MLRVGLGLQVASGEVAADKMHRKGIITAVGNHKKLFLGQRVQLEGHWTKHEKYGQQLQVRYFHNSLESKCVAVKWALDCSDQTMGENPFTCMIPFFSSELMFSNSCFSSHTSHPSSQISTNGRLSPSYPITSFETLTLLERQLENSFLENNTFACRLVMSAILERLLVG